MGLLPQSLTAIRVFDAAARHRSCSRAAHELCLTQSAVSKQIQALEAHLGLPLFHRLHHGLELTAAGQIYWDAIEPALQQLAQATNRVRALLADETTINLGVPPTLGQKWLIPRLAGFARAHPEITVQFMPRLPQAGHLSTLHAEIRFGRCSWPGVHAHYLVGRELYPVCGPALLARQPVRTPADLVRHRLLEHMELPNVWERWFAGRGTAGYDARRVQKHEQFSLMISALNAGLGVGILPRFLVEEELRQRMLVMVDDRAMKSDHAYYLVHAKDRQTGGALACFIRWILDEAARTPT